ncbi:MAG TPA: TIM-barrel domain-containing protein [Acidobacteriaceae bacterium]|jgi:alpha-glucosidase|nr:TIM-barrel domain-containing protein [Acidobacteriaceae bacterium]
MRLYRYSSALLLLSLCRLSLPAQEPQVSALPNGVIVHSADCTEQITALRDDVLRIRLWRGSNPPEDASWAVLSQARHNSTTAVAINGDAFIGFRTHALTVKIDRQTLEITIEDPSGHVLQQDARPVRFDGAAFRIYKKMPLDEHYFGLGDKTGPLDRRNEAFTLWNTDAYRFQESTDPIYKSIPYFIADREGQALGVLLDNTWRSSFDFGKETPDAYSFGAANGPIDYYVFYGPSPKQVVETYAWLTGTPPLPPRWTFGFQQSRYSYMTQARVLEVAKHFRDDRIPADALYLDIDYQDRNRPFTVNTTAFPDLRAMIAQLRAENFHVVLITDLHIANLPGQHYFPYDSGMAGDHFVKNPDGSVYTGRVWPGPSVFPDFTRQQTRAWWGTLYRGFHNDGAEGFWNDMNEPSIFDSPTFTMPLDVVHRIDEPGFRPRTATHAEIHDVYGMENSRATFEGLRTLDPNTRPFVLTRATYAGGQRYASTWTGDNSSTWNHLRLATPMLVNLGLSGFAFSGADVGGYAGSPSPDLLTKWIEVGAFQPIDRDHTEKDTADQEPWVGDSRQESIRRHFIEVRYQLLPYLYTLADEASRTGLPLLRPLFLEFPDAAPDRHPLDTDLDAGGEFLLGSDLLVAPGGYPDQAGPYPVEFPSQSWYDFWTGAPVQASLEDASTPPSSGPFSISVPAQPAQLPVFVRGGSILPIAPLVQSTNQIPQGPLTLRVYAGAPCSGALYWDDGRSYAYQHGAFLRMQFHCQIDPQGLHLNIGAHQGSWPAWWKDIRVEIYGFNAGHGEVEVNGSKAQTSVAHDKQRLVFTVADDGKGLNIDLR